MTDKPQTRSASSSCAIALATALAAATLGGCAGQQATMGGPITSNGPYYDDQRPSNAAEIDAARAERNRTRGEYGGYTGHRRFAGRSIVRTIPGTETLRWGFNNLGYLENGRFVSEASLEGCFRTEDVVVMDRTSGTEFEATVVREQMIGVSKARCIALDSTFGTVTDGINGLRRQLRNATPTYGRHRY